MVLRPKRQGLPVNGAWPGSNQDKATRRILDHIHGIKPQGRVEKDIQVIQADHVRLGSQEQIMDRVFRGDRSQSRGQVEQRR